MWDDENGRILLFTTSKKAREFFEELFKKSFLESHEGSLLRVTPPVMGISEKEWGEPAKLKAALDKLQATVPTSFSAGIGH
jgi:hypothetical protein